MKPTLAPCTYSKNKQSAVRMCSRRGLYPHRAADTALSCGDLRATLCRPPLTNPMPRTFEPAERRKPLGSGPAVPRPAVDHTAAWAGMMDVKYCGEAGQIDAGPDGWPAAARPHEGEYPARCG